MGPYVFFALKFAATPFWVQHDEIKDFGHWGK
jgi:hypothetical protein